MEKAKTFTGNIQVNHYDAEGLRHEIEEIGRLVSFIFRDREIVAESSKEDTIRYIRGYDILCSDSECVRMYYHYVCDEIGSRKVNYPRAKEHYPYKKKKTKSKTWIILD